MSKPEAPHPAGATPTSQPGEDALNLGSGEDYREGYLNVDYNDRYNPDTVVDLRESWPADWHGQFDHILASHIFEHLPNLEHAFREAARCLQPGGTLEVRVPLGANAMTDWTHEHLWTYDTPLQFAQNWREFSDAYQFDPSVPFHLVERDVNMTMHGPLRSLSPVVQWLADRDPGVWTSTVPCASGELTAVFERVIEP